MILGSKFSLNGILTRFISMKKPQLPQLKHTINSRICYSNVFITEHVDCILPDGKRQKKK